MEALNRRIKLSFVEHHYLIFLLLWSTNCKFYLNQSELCFLFVNTENNVKWSVSSLCVLKGVETLTPHICFKELAPAALEVT